MDRMRAFCNGSRLLNRCSLMPIRNSLPTFFFVFVFTSCSSDAMCQSVENIAADCARLLAAKRKEIESHESAPFVAAAAAATAAPYILAAQSSVPFVSVESTSVTSSDSESAVQMEISSVTMTASDSGIEQLQPAASTPPAPSTTAAASEPSSSLPASAFDWDRFEVQLFARELQNWAQAFMPKPEGKPDDLTILVAKIKRASIQQ